MLLFISWLFALVGSELLLLQINSVSIIMPLLYLSMGIMYLYQKNKIRNMLWLDANLKKHASSTSRFCLWQRLVLCYLSSRISISPLTPCLSCNG